MLVDVLTRSRHAFARPPIAVVSALRGRRCRPRPALPMSLLVVLVLVLGTACVGAHAQGLDVFGQPTGAAANAASTPNNAPNNATTPPSWWVRDMPNFVRTGVGEWLRAQATWNARIEGFLAQWSHGASLAAGAVLIVASFGYGALHALGPGHGKLVVSTYLGSRRARVMDAVLLSSWTATVQALSAIGLVLGAAWFAHTGLTSIMPHAASVEVVSYLLLCVTSAWALRSSGARNPCCDEPPIVRFPGNEDANAGHPIRNALDVANRDQSTHGVYLRARLPNAVEARDHNATRSVRETADSRPMPKRQTRSRITQIATLGLAAGLRPCMGAVFALVTSMATRALTAGIIVTFAMAAGVATTVALIGLGSIGANRTLARLALRFRIRSARAGRIVAIGAIGAILLISALQLALLLSGITAASFS